MASAADAGSALAADSAGTGGTAYVPAPKIKAVKCLKSCMSGGRVKNGGKLKLRGAALGNVTKVVYLGAAGGGDGVAVTVGRARDKSVTVLVPYAPLSGRMAPFAG